MSLKWRKIRMKKKLTAMLLAIVMVLSTTTIPVSATGQKFTDVPSNHWAYSYIQSAAADGVMNGTGDGLFSPSKTLSRAEFIVMMMRAFYSEEVTTKETELKSKGIGTAWYTAHCALAYDKGLLSNTDGCSAIEDSVLKLYRPNSILYELADDLSVSSAVSISRVDMAAIAGSIMLDKGISELSDADYEAISATIPDFEDVPYSCRRNMATVYYYKVITGVDATGTFNPSGTVDRAVAATIYCRLSDLLDGTEVKLTPKPVPSEVPETPTPSPVPTETPAPTPSVEPTPAPSEKPVNNTKKAPYATTDDSIVGTISDSRVTLSLKTHKAPVDYWGKHPELNGLVDKDQYNAYVFTALNRKWIAENGIIASYWSNGAWTDGVDNFNYPCFSTKYEHYMGVGIPFTDYAVGGITKGGMYIQRVGDVDSDDIGVYVVDKVHLEDEQNGAFVPIFAKFTPNMTDKEKIVIMVEALCEKMTYNTQTPDVEDIPRAGTSTDTEFWSSTYPVLKGICDDYAVAFSQICRAAGIPCMTCTGTYPDRNEGHAWNLVYVDGEWLVVDPSELDIMIENGLSFEDACKNVDVYIFHTEKGYANTGLTCDMTKEKLIIEALYRDVYGE